MGPAASSAALKRSTSSLLAAQPKASSSNQTQDPKGNVCPPGAGPLVGKSHAPKAAASKATAAYQSAKAVVSADQPSSNSEPVLDSSSKHPTVAAPAQNGSKAQASKQTNHDVRKSSTGLGPQVASYGDAKSAETQVKPGKIHCPVNFGTISHEQRSNTAATASLFPASQPSPSGTAEIAASKGAGNTVLPSGIRPVQAGSARSFTPVVYATSGDAAKPEDQDDGIITSATIAKLASRSSAQQAKQGQQAQPGKALTMGQTASNRPNGVASSAAVTGKRKSPHTQDSSAVTGSTLPAAAVKPAIKLPPGPPQRPSATPKDPATASPQTPSPNAASPDQPGPSMRKKIRWDPEAAGVNTAAVRTRPHNADVGQHYPRTAERHASTAAAAALLVTAARGRTSQPASQALSSLAPISSAFHAQPGSRQPGQAAVSSQGAARQQGAIHKSNRDSEEGKEEAEEMQRKKSGGFATVLRGDLQWSWGVGAAIQGQFPAAFVDVMPVSAAASAGECHNFPAHAKLVLAYHAVMQSCTSYTAQAYSCCLRIA